MFFTAEVIETKKAYKPNQKDSKGRLLPLGSILLRGNSNSIGGQVANFYARPLHFNKRIPFIGEHVLVCQGPVHDHSTANQVSNGFMYLTPYNATDDVAINQFPKLWERSKHHDGSAPSVKADRKEIGYNFIKNNEIKSVESIQPFEGDEIIEGRMGQSLRFGSTIEKDLSIYHKKPTWKDSGNGDPIIVLRLKKPTGTKKRDIDIETDSEPNVNKYSIENIEEDDASVYLTTSQKLEKLKPGFEKNKEVKKTPKWKDGSQIVVDAERVVLNAKKDKIFLVGAKEAIISAKKITFQSDKHNVDLDDLMDFIKDHLSKLNDLATGTKFFLTSMGPTSTATNMAEITKLLNADFPKKFKKP